MSLNKVFKSSDGQEIHYKTNSGQVVMTNGTTVEQEISSIKESVLSNRPIVINDDVPVGTVVFTSSTSVLNGWLKCDGRSVSATDYPELYKAIGTTFGGTSTNFNIPNIPLENLIVDSINSGNTEINSISVKSQIAIIKAKQVAKDMETVAQEWTSFIENGGTIQSPITVNDKVFTKYVVSLDKFLRLFTTDNKGVMVDTNANRFVPSTSESLSLGDGTYKWNALHQKGGKIHFVDSLGENGGLVIQADNGKQLGFTTVSADGSKVNQLKLACNNDGGRYFLPTIDKSVNLGSNDYKFKDVYVGDYNINTNGYTKLPNGLILQWGVATITGGVNGMQISFPLKFTNNVLSLSATVVDSAKGTTSVQTWITGKNVSNFYIRTNEASSINWIALGY